MGLPQFGSFSIRAITSSADRTAPQSVRALWLALVWVHLGPHDAAEGVEAILPAT